MQYVLLSSLKQYVMHTVIVSTQRQEGKVNAAFEIRIHLVYKVSLQMFYISSFYTPITT